MPARVRANDTRVGGALLLGFLGLVLIGVGVSVAVGIGWGTAAVGVACTLHAMVLTVSKGRDIRLGK